MTTGQIESTAVVATAPPIPFFTKWRSFGTGVGIEVGPKELLVTLTVVRPSGIKVLDSLVIPSYRERPAAEWGEEYASFLRKHKLSHLSASVVLPAKDCVSRSLPMPGVAPAELASAIQYQLDGLHPFSEDAATHSFARLAGERSGHVAIAIAKNEIVEDYASLFDEAGVNLLSFLTPSSAIYSAMRVLQHPPSNQFLAIHEDASGLLVYGESETHPIYCVQLSLDNDRAIAATASQLRLSEDAPQSRLASLLSAAERLDVSSPLSYAASLSSALPALTLPLNLLPVNRRRIQSPWRWVPTAILVLLLMVLGTGFAYYQEYENNRILVKLDAEIAKLQPRLAIVRQLESDIESASRRLEFLNGIATYPQQDLESLRELTRMMPMNSYVSRLDMSRSEVTLSGETEQSMEMLKMFDSSLFFKDTEFTSSPNRLPNGKELFQIRTRRELPQEAAKVASPAPANAAPPNSTPLPRFIPAPPPAIQGFRP
ncbi:MAG: hypothetical protein FJW36_10215 [Acidobacteria bacterium]|nr:hypothetical protein [Acidobacteriota bacterium]